MRNITHPTSSCQRPLYHHEPTTVASSYTNELINHIYITHVIKQNLFSRVVTLIRWVLSNQCILALQLMESMNSFVYNSHWLTSMNIAGFTIYIINFIKTAVCIVHTRVTYATMIRNDDDAILSGYTYRTKRKRDVDTYVRRLAHGIPRIVSRNFFWIMSQPIHLTNVTRSRRPRPEFRYVTFRNIMRTLETRRLCSNERNSTVRHRKT